jgi:hypothetical protein
VGLDAQVEEEQMKSLDITINAETDSSLLSTLLALTSMLVSDAAGGLSKVYTVGSAHGTGSAEIK